MILRVGLVQSQLIGNVSEVLKHKLRASLSYENRGQIIQRLMYMRKYGKKVWQLPPHLRWNGITCLLGETNKFPTGCLDIVKEILNTNNIEYEEVITYKIAEGTPLTLAKEITLWDHQLAAINAMKSNNRGIVKAGCGAGKTILSIFASAAIGQLPVLFVVNRISLLKQAHADYEKFLGIKVGFIGDGIMTFGKVNIATIHTLCSILKIEQETDDADEKENITYTKEQIDMLLLMLKATRMVIVDEVHHSSSDMYLKLLKELPAATHRYGLTATNFRNDGTDLLLEAGFGREIYSISSSELIQKGILAKPYITFIDYEDELSKKFPYLTQAQEDEYKSIGKKLPRKAPFTSVYKACVVENDTYNHLIATIALHQAAKGLLTLISVRQIAHGNNILEIIRNLQPNISVEFLHGGNKNELDEEKIKADFAFHKIQILISTLFDEGVDIPAIDVAIDGGGGASGIKTIQLAGRAMRKYPGKEKAHIFMFTQRYTHLYNHSIERLKILKTEPEFEIKVLEWPKKTPS